MRVDVVPSRERAKGVASNDRGLAGKLLPELRLRKRDGRGDDSIDVGVDGGAEALEARGDGSVETNGACSLARGELDGFDRAHIGWREVRR